MYFIIFQPMLSMEVKLKESSFRSNFEFHRCCGDLKYYKLPCSGSIFESGFPLMNLIMNELRNSVSIWALDATMRIHYSGQTLSEEEIDNIIQVWKRRGNRPIEL